jgi:putative hemolysin
MNGSQNPYEHRSFIMKNVQLVGLSALLSLAVACASQTEPTDGNDGTLTAPVRGGTATPAPTPAPTPSPAPSPSPTCTPLAPPMGGVNPASVYCVVLGYEASSDQCTFPDATSCEQWAFFRGECGQAHSFCNLHGGTVSNKIEDMGTWTASYAVCTLPTGKHCEEGTFARTCSCE